MGDTVLASWLRGGWRWWRGLGGQLHEDIFTLCVFAIAGSAWLFSDRWAGLAGWIWAGLGTSKEQLLTLGTVALAIVTYGLFSKTAGMAKATVAMAQAAQADSIRSDRQHQQTLSGMLAIKDLRVVLGAPQPYNPEGKGWTPATGLWQQEFQITGSVRNVGNGPALGVTLIVTLPGGILHGGDVFSSVFVRPIGGLAPNEQVELSEIPGAPFMITELVAGLDNVDLVRLTVTVNWRTVFDAFGSVKYVIFDEWGDYTEQVEPPAYVPLAATISPP